MADIPPIQHRLWIGPPLPDHYADWIGQWEATHPGWDHRMWTEADLTGFANQDLLDRRTQISPTAAHQFASDVARYEILAEFGGVWLDCDIIPHRPIDALMDGTPWVVRHAERWVANGIMAFPPGHPVMAEAIYALPASVARHPTSAGNTRRSGPQFLTPIVKRHSDVRVLPSSTFIPYEWDELDRHGEVWGTYGTHVFNNQRRKKDRPLPTVTP